MATNLDGVVLPDGSEYGFDAATVSGHKVMKDVPEDAKFTDTVASLNTTQITLMPTNWVGDAAPYTYDLGEIGKKAVIQFDSTKGTKEQYEAACAAMIAGGSSTLLYAWGDKPTVEIPVVVLYE